MWAFIRRFCKSTSVLWAMQDDHNSSYSESDGGLPRPSTLKRRKPGASY